MWEELRHSVINIKYGISSNGWDSNFVLTGTCRSPWKDLTHGYNSFIMNCHFVVGNGERIMLWEDTWLGDSPLNLSFHRSTIRLVVGTRTLLALWTCPMVGVKN